jgi:hypothetical protein
LTSSYEGLLFVFAGRLARRKSSKSKPLQSAMADATADAAVIADGK